VAINYFFAAGDLGNRILQPGRTDAKALLVQSFGRFLSRHGIELATLDTVDFADPRVRYVVYFDFSWRTCIADPFLRHIPREKRVLVIIEPSNVNPSLYHAAFFRDRFGIVFTWHQGLLRRNPAYVGISVLAGADPETYRRNPFAGTPYAAKRLLCAVSRNRWSYVPYSTYEFRIRAYRHFERTLGAAFDLYGIGWNAPRVFYERWFGHRAFACYRGPIPESSDEKVRMMAQYRFALCIENNVRDAGYVSEKIIDALCARCVPVYYGWEGIGRLVPAECFVDLRAFRSLDDLGRFLAGMSAETHQRYIDAADAFLAAPEAHRFTNRAIYETIYTRLFVGDGGGKGPGAAAAGGTPGHA
jgi:hypothetical protein